MMTFGIGTCPCCGSQNSVFRGVKPLVLQTLVELADKCESAAYVVDWKCWHCGLRFQTETKLQGVGGRA